LELINHDHDPYAGVKAESLSGIAGNPALTFFVVMLKLGQVAAIPLFKKVTLSFCICIPAQRTKTETYY
jgi:hypothetical protein